MNVAEHLLGMLMLAMGRKRRCDIFYGG
jgi:hypothetical protein